MTEAAIPIITIGDYEETPRPTSRPKKRCISQSFAVDSEDEIILESDWRKRRQPVRRGRVRPRHNIGGREDDVVVLPPPPRPPRRQRRSPVPPPPPSDWEMRQASLWLDFRGGKHGNTNRQRRGPLGNFGDIGDNQVILLDHSPPPSPPPPPPPSSSDSSDLRRRRESKLTTERGSRVYRGERGEVTF